MKKAWITWEVQPRNKSMASLMEADYYEFDSSSSILKRYFLCIKNTINVFKKDYSLIFVQNPSIILSLLGVILKKFYKKTLVIDAHNAGVYPKEGKYKLLNKFNLRILRSADYVIVTNYILSSYLDRNDVNSAVFSDPLPTIKCSNTYLQDEQFVFIICSWSPDEPMELYFELARQLAHVKFKITGNYRKYTGELKGIPKNIDLLGFVGKDDYDQFLCDASLVVDLTTREDCLVCGAYEAMSANQLIVLTDSQVNRDVFGEHALYSKLAIESLVDVVKNGLDFEKIDNEQFKRNYQEVLERRKRIFFAKINN